MSKLKNIKVKSFADFNKSSLKKTDNINEILYLDTSSIFKDRILNIQKIPVLNAPSRAKRIVKINDIIYSTVRPNLEHYGYIGRDRSDIIVSTGFCVISVNNEELVDSKYFYYYLTLKSITNRLHSIAQSATSSYPSITSDDLKNLNVNIFNCLDRQKRISLILSSIDDKIELNNKINAELESMAKTIYDYWFIQFDFPDENGKPYKSSGGKMVYNEILKKEIPENWTISNIKSLVNNVVTGKEDANFAKENGIYPFFTCSNSILKCSEYAFDSKAILIAGNGDFNVKYYEGKFNAYQRTYVLMPKNEEHTGVIYQHILKSIRLLKNSSVGSIVKFITKGDVENINVVIPDNEKILNYFNMHINQITHNKKEIKQLEELRDWLLPMLMNGQVGFKSLDN